MAKDLVSNRTDESRPAKRVQLQRTQLREIVVMRLRRGTNVNFGRAMSGARYSTGRNPSTDRYRSPVS